MRGLPSSTTPLVLVLADVLVRRLLPAEMLQPLLVSSCYWRGAPTPLALVLANILVRRRQPTIFSPPGTTFHTFSDWILLKHNTIIWRPHFIKFSYWTHSYHWSSKQSILASSISESLNHWNPITRPQSRTLNSATIFRANCIIKIMHQSAYATWKCWTSVYTQLHQGEPAYMSLITYS